jgi:plastocyanin
MCEVCSADTVFLMRFPLALALSVMLFGCGADTVSGSSDSSSPMASPVAQITIEKMQFSVPTTVSSTGALELVNNDSVGHNLMLMDESFSVDVGPGKTVALPQFKPGEYSFHCHIHPTMIATLTVS